MLVSSGPAAEDTRPAPHEWLNIEPLDEAAKIRRSGRDGANCIQILARVHGMNVDGARLAPQLPATLEEMEAAAKSIGLNLDAVDMTLSEAMGAGAFICYLEESIDDGGQFCIAICGHDAEFIWVIHGSTATIRQYTGDEFRRIWRGYGLVVRQADSRISFQSNLIFAILAGCVLGGFGSLWLPAKKGIMP